MSQEKKLTSVDILERNAESYGRNLALLAEGVRYNFEEFRDRCLVLGQFLASRGVNPGTRVGFFLNGYAEFFTSMFATWLAGGVVVPVNVSLPLKTCQYIIQKAACSLCLTDGTQDATGWDNCRIINLSEFEGDQAVTLSRKRITPDDDAIIMFTSGTTGVPRGVPFPHRNVWQNASLVSDVLGLKSSDRIMINTPPYYTSAICHLLTLFAKGGGVVAKSGFFFGADLLDTIEREGCTGFGGAPAHFSKIVESVEAVKRPARLRFLVSSGDHLPEHIIEKTGSIFPGVQLFPIYGLTEVAGRLCILDPKFLPKKMGSVGHPLPGMEIVIRRDDLSEAERGESGEVFVRGPLLMKGYLDEKSLNRDLLGPDGFRTGDFGYIDFDGFLFLQGRRDDIFKCGGEKVSHLLISKEIAKCYDFIEFAVLPLEDELLGKVPKVFYVLSKDQVFDRKKLIKCLKSKLPPTHIPRKFARVSEIPRTGSGKIIKRELDNFIIK
ncbi:MAG: acyl--CoA ligase [Deltaproteobacteria bacterium]|nr:acyl--CoA ligase [Deltaproteobacteria bacterium]